MKHQLTAERTSAAPIPTRLQANGTAQVVHGPLKNTHKELKTFYLLKRQISNLKRM